MVKKMGSGLGQFKVKSWLFYLLAVVTDLQFLNL